MRALALAVAASCTTSPPPAAIHNAAATSAVPTALEGRIVDSSSGAPVPGIRVEAISGSSSDETISDEHGHYHLAIAAGSAYLQLEYERGSDIATPLGRVTSRDLRIDHDELVERRKRRPPPACPSSPPGTIIIGHTLAQPELDAIAHRVLERYASDPTTVSHGAVASRVAYVRTDLERHRALGSAAIPDGFVGETSAKLAVEPLRTGTDVYYVNIHSIDADASCALVSIGIDFAQFAPGPIKMCCCSATQIYELRGGTWEFVADAEKTCS
jgi:hypothetical protein